jgi:hypothetical protein
MGRSPASAGRPNPRWARLGHELAEFLDRHPSTAGIDMYDKNPQRCLEDIGSDL